MLNVFPAKRESCPEATRQRVAWGTFPQIAVWRPGLGHFRAVLRREEAYRDHPQTVKAVDVDDAATGTLLEAQYGLVAETTKDGRL